ncbi:Cro/CI family transcriptional regulator [Pseudomonas aeruginosa]|nr:Cro/CI family transcriptional regulator [Pseudomonas aeruginosa]
MYQVKVISLLGNKWCNGRMDIHDIRRQRLKRIIAETYSGNAAKLAMEAELSPSYLSRIFTSNPTHRRNIGEKLARSIEQKLGLNEGALDVPVYDSVLERTPEGFRVVPANPPAAQSNAEYVGMISVWDDDTPVEEDEVEVPFLREVELAAGTGKTYIEETSRWKLRFGKYTLRRKGVQPENAVCVVVRGNSMEPILPDGSTVGVDRGATNIVDGKVYALKDDGMLRVKTLYRLPGGMVRLRSYNRDEYSDEDRELESIEIIGRVFWSSVLW